MKGHKIMDNDMRKHALSTELVGRVRDGWRVESQSDYHAVLVRGKKVNHILHLLLSVFTGGLWLIVWLALAAKKGEKRVQIHVGEHGSVITSKA